MKILFITPGSGDGYYCGNCFRDNLQAQALHHAGHDVTIMPLYLPLNYIGQLQGNSPIFFPATSFYVDQMLKGKSPDWLNRMLSARPLLNMASALSGTTSANGMEGMTLSMIEGDDPAFVKSCAQLVDYVCQEKPDVIQLSSTLIIGIAREIRKAVDIPIVCSIQDEEVWLDGLEKQYADRAWNSITEYSRYVDKFITTSRYYADIAARRMPGLPQPEIIYPGIDTERYAAQSWPEHPTIGFFYRMNSLDGLDILADAYVLLKQRGSIPDLKLRIGGGYMSPDKSLMRQVRHTLKPYSDDVTIEEEYSWLRHPGFYRDITVLSNPLRFNEGVGLYLCEAFAAGRPAVEPATGSFPEILDGAGLTYTPNTPAALADALERILTDRDLFDRSSARAFELSQMRYNATLYAQSLAALYSTIS
ncbi:MAG: glycosyltransferase family 4 protein [Bacteroidaceae bacterium]|nr:glycosyltransferase family 4 protein [Bacteroidaceae bacterium]